MSVLLSTPSTMTFSSNACLYLLESVVSLLLGSPLIFQIILPVFCSSRSSWRPIPFGLAQGSVLGPLLYILFTAEIDSLLASCSLLSHSYADDVQAYKHCLASDVRSAILSVSRATGLLNEWMSSSRLRLNPLKTQCIWLSTRQQLAKLDLVSRSHEFPTFVFSTYVRDLGDNFRPGTIFR